MTGNSNAGGPIVGINVAPLVDIALVLLIIFIITAKLVITPSIPLDLPQAKKSEEVQTILSIIISSEGELLANGTPISDLSKLTWLAKEQLGQEPQLRAVISADGGTPHRKVISVLDALRVAGIARVAFGVTAEDENDE